MHGSHLSIDNFLLRPDHYNHFGAIRTKKIIGNRKVNKPARSKNSDNHRYSVPVDMIERVNPDKPNDNYNYMMGDINVHSPIVEKDGGWKWYKDGELEKKNSFNINTLAQQGEEMCNLEDGINFTLMMLQL